MWRRVSVTEFVRGFADYINRVAYQGERLVLVRGRRELAEVRPRVQGRRLGELADVLAALPRLGTEEAEAFAADLSAARVGVGEAREVEWPS